MNGYPRVTAILQAAGLAPDFAGVHPSALEIARARGTRVHAYLEADHYGLMPAVLPEDQGYFMAYQAFLAETKHEPTISEFEVVSERWRYCGHVDRLGFLVQQRCLIDFKTGVFDPIYTARQLCLYRLAWEEMHPHLLIPLTLGLELRSDGSYRVHELDSRAEEQVVLAALVVYRAQRRKT